MSDVVRIAAGALAGAVRDGVVTFAGVPYAAPPTGARRFAPPAPAAPWQGVRDARMHGPIAPQPAGRLRAAMGDIERPQSEDCLTLTISTPAAQGARPVLVWLHGGAYMSGAGSLDWYDGAALARDGDMVVVGVNYRLGALGFLQHPAIGGGNRALDDMQAALAWVHDHIAAFGGDPACITVLGQSAGAHAIMCLLTSEARGLFHRAILLSAPASLRPLRSEEAAGYAEQLLARLAIPLASAAEGLRSVPVDRLLEAQVAVSRAAARFADIAPPFVPVFDALADVGAFIAAAARGAAAAGIDLLLGTTREEMGAFFAPDPAMAAPDPAAVAARFAALGGDIEVYRARRPGGGLRDLLGDLVTDCSFLFPSLALADAVTALGRRVWAYQFNWSAPGNRFGACHCIDLPFVFGTPWPDAAMLEGGDAAEIAALSKTIRGAVAAFARVGDPSSDGLPWPPYRPPDRKTMCYGPVTGVIGDLAGLSGAFRAEPDHFSGRRTQARPGADL